jgi:hypothetical protein
VIFRSHPNFQEIKGQKPDPAKLCKKVGFLQHNLNIYAQDTAW